MKTKVKLEIESHPSYQNLNVMTADDSFLCSYYAESTRDENRVLNEIRNEFEIIEIIKTVCQYDDDQAEPQYYANC